MADQFDTHVTDSDVRERTGPSVVLLLAGLAALLVSIWALAGPSAWSGLPDIHLGWVVVVGAIVVGLGLVFSPRKR